MSENRLLKYLEKSEELARNVSIESKRKTAIVVSDSKGRYLKEVAHNALLDSNGNVVECTRPNLIEEGIKWKYKGGRTAPEGSRWLRANFKQMQIKYGEIAVYFWLGTCDMTRKLGEFIRLRKDYLDYAALLLIKLEKLIKFANRHNFALTFLEIPIYSIKEYNASKGHSNPDKFDEQDRKLREVTRHRHGTEPSLLDLIFTNESNINLTNKTEN